MIYAPMPRVRALLPFHNAPANLDQCLASILAQTLVDFELLAVDDGGLPGFGPSRRKPLVPLPANGM